jgi:hypothetical protein
MAAVRRSYDEGQEVATMKRVALAVIAASAMATGAGGIVLAGPAHAAAATNGCPSGYQLLSVQTLTDEGYRVPALVDSPSSGVLSFGQPGNGDGYVCGVQLGNQLTSFGLPIYNFIDNQLPA